MSANNRIVARRLNVLLRESRDQMHQWIEPVHRLGEQHQQTVPAVMPAMVQQLVAEDHLQFFLRQHTVGQHNLGPQKTQQHRTGSLSGNPQFDRRFYP